MSALLEVAGVSKALRRPAGAATLRARGRGGIDHRPDRPERLRQDDAVQRHHRLRARRPRARSASRGAPITGSRPDRVFALGIGRTFQLTRIFARLTVLENMLVATQRHEGWLRGVLRRAGSRAERRRARWSCSTSSGSPASQAEPAGNLSYGQRKLLELASLLVADPAVILLDEPAGGVNPTLIDQLAERIRELNRRRQDVPRRRAQHGVRDGPLRPRHRARARAATLASGAPDEVRARPGRARRLPRRGGRGRAGAGAARVGRRARAAARACAA